MTSDVVLSAALRSNLLSLQQTQRGIDSTQLKLSTGKKVNSALDNPQSFFAAQALTNRASDLTKLLDSIGQSIQVIKAADNGVTALTSLVNQAQAIATSAQDAISGASQEAKVTGDRDLTATTKLTSIAGITVNDTIQITVTDPAVPGTPAISAQTITIGANDTAADLVTKINDLNTNLTTQAVDASLNSNGQLVIKAANGGILRINFQTAANLNPNNQALASALGFGTQARLITDGGAAAASNVELTAGNSAVLTSFGLYEAVGNIAERGDAINGLVRSDGTAVVSTFTGAGNNLVIGVNGGTGVTISSTGLTIQGLIDAINTNATLNTKIQASFNETTGQISIAAIDATVTDIQFGVQSDNVADVVNFGFGAISDFSITANQTTTENIRFGAAAGTLASLQVQYESIRTQIDELVTNGDTGYRGTNLLNGDNLISYFNESRTSKLTTVGASFNSAGLGLGAANFSTTDTISANLTEAQDALTALRNFGGTLATDLATIQARQDFTTGLINTLKAGSDLLVNADQNEEGAKLLALQTRQSLGVTALSLASQSQQSILRLFG